MSKNLYHRRLVAESGAKACWICFKPSSTVLITPTQDDWFHICPGHLKDGRFAIAKDAEDLEKKKQEEEMNKEVEAVTKEYEEKMRKKEKDKGDKKEDEKDDKTKVEKDDKDDKKDDTEKDAKPKEPEKGKEPTKSTVDGPRLFELHRNFYQMRLQKKRDAELAKRNRDRLRNPSTFPSVPTGDVS